MDGNGAIVECLIIGVAKHERHIVNPFFKHVVHGIATTTAYTDDFDNTISTLGHPEIEDIELFLPLTRLFVGLYVKYIFHIKTFWGFSDLIHRS